MRNDDTICVARKDAAAGTIPDSVQGTCEGKNEYLPGGVRRWAPRNNQSELCDQVGNDAEEAGEAQFNTVWWRALTGK